jgi:hypothetical protein
MKTVILTTFIQDLRENSDPNFAKRVFRKVFDSNGIFREDSDDHRYEGINGAWIRYVSQGGAAFRVIYIREGEAVYVYRCGTHSIERKLAGPINLEGLGVTDATGTAAIAGYGFPSPVSSGAERLEEGRIVTALRPPTVQQLFLSRRVIPHREIHIVSPFLTLELLGRHAKYGRVIDDQIEDGSAISLVTRPPSEDTLPAFDDLEARGVELFFHETLHSKLYTFVVDKHRLRWGEQTDDLMILGSANLTGEGFSDSRDTGNEELCYELPRRHRKEIDSYLGFLKHKALDLIKIKQRWARVTKRRPK